MKFHFEMLSASIALALGCGGSQHPPTATASEQAPLAVAAYDSRAEPAQSHGDHPGAEHHAKGPMHDAAMLLETGHYADAAAQLQQLTQAEPDNAKAWLLYGYALHADGQLDAALQVHMQAARFDQVAPTALYNVACVQALQGKAEAALATLEQAAAKGFGGAEHAATDADLASLRDDPRFEAFLAHARAAKAAHGGHKAGEAMPGEQP